MKFRKAVVACACLILAYTAGKYAGHIKCLKNVAKQYGSHIPGDEMISSKVSKGVTLSVPKTPKKETSDL